MFGEVGGHFRCQPVEGVQERQSGGFSRFFAERIAQLAFPETKGGGPWSTRHASTPHQSIAAPHAVAPAGALPHPGEHLFPEFYSSTVASRSIGPTPPSRNPRFRRTAGRISASRRPIRW